jgi:hypothetical protein
MLLPYDDDAVSVDYNRLPRTVLLDGRGDFVDGTLWNLPGVLIVRTDALYGPTFDIHVPSLAFLN